MNTKAEKRERQIQRIIDNDVLYGQSHLVEALISAGFEGHEPGIDIDDIINFKRTEEEAKEMGFESLSAMQDAGEDNKEVFEWWCVTEWLANKIKNLGGVIIKSDYGTWWGREETGQSLTMDYHINQVADVVVGVKHNDV